MGDLKCCHCLGEVVVGDRAEDAVSTAHTIIMGDAVCRHHLTEGFRNQAETYSDVIQDDDDGGEQRPNIEIPDSLDADLLAPPPEEQPSMFKDERERKQ